jgi:molybdopterin-guanine dinucleotide biosynthesis protein A
MPVAGVALTGVILAGGLSRRLGRDKATLQLHGRPLARWVAAALQPLVRELWLVTNQPLEHRVLDLPMLTDLLPSRGPLGGLLTALFFSRTPWVLAASVDSPLLSTDLLAALAHRAARTSRPAVVCHSPRGLEVFPGLFHVRLRPRLEDYLQRERRLRPFVAACRPEVLPPAETARWDARGVSFLNLNTPAELAAVARMAQAGQRV